MDESELTLEGLLAMGPMAPVRNPYPLFKKLRDVSPIARISDEQCLTLSYDASRAVLKDSELFPSAINQRTMGMVMGPNIVGMDGAEHLKHRALITPALAPRALRGDFPTLVASIANRIIDDFAGNQRADLSSEFTFVYPLTVFIEILGLPQGEVEKVHNWGIDLTMVAHDPGKGIAASELLGKYLLPIVERRRLEPADDLISVLVNAEVEGSKLTDIEVVSFLRLLVLAGAETTYHLMGTSLYVLLKDRELMERVRSDRSLITGLLHETLRWDSPISTVMREAGQDTEIGGIPIAKETGVLVHIGAANRDPAQFENPDTFDIDRLENDHIAFGLGKHYCAGSRLAFLEAETGINLILDRLGDLREEPGEDYGIEGFSFRGPNRLPVLFS